MSTNPQSNRDGKTETKSDRIEPNYVSYNVILQAQKWFEYDRRFQNTEMYNELHVPPIQM